MMKRELCLVVGASGFIGNILWHRLPPDNRQGTFCSHPLPGLVPLDIRDVYRTSAFIKRLSPSVIFQPAAMPSADACEVSPEECWAINVEGTGNLARAAREVGAKLVFFSSDYVFDGRNGPYTESDAPHPINMYGETKLAAESLIQELVDDYLIIRINIVYGWERRRKNFVTGLIDRLRRGELMKVPIDQVGCPTYVDNLVDVVLELVVLNQCGTFHVAGDQVMDRYTFACLAADIFDLDRQLLVPVRTTELRQRAMRPLKAGLRIEKTQSVISTLLLGPREGLHLMKKQGDPFVSKS